MIIKIHTNFNPREVCVCVCVERSKLPPSEYMFSGLLPDSVCEIGIHEMIPTTINDQRTKRVLFFVSREGILHWHRNFGFVFIFKHTPLVFRTIFVWQYTVDISLFVPVLWKLNCISWSGCVQKYHESTNA